MITVPFAEGGITNLRRELKLLVDAGEAEALCARLAGLARSQDSQVVAVYLDSPAARLARRAAGSPDDCVKVRVKAYDPDRSGSGRVVLEVKRERGGVTSKERVWVERARVREVVSRALAPAFGRLAPAVATSYRRRVFQACPGWRVTLDEGLRFRPASWALFSPGAPPWSAALPPAFAAEPRVVVELKYGPDGLPAWLAELGRTRAVPYSKFSAASAHAWGGRSAGA